ncbi:MAG: ribbon-helix-helix domain-containing protein [Thainema sp.]
MIDDAVSKRFYISLPDGIADVLTRWAESEGNKPTSLAAFLVEKAVREAIDSGKVPPPHEIDRSDK